MSKSLEQRTEFDQNPDDFIVKCKTEQEALQNRIVEAQNRLSTVSLDREFQVKISEVCSELDVDGLRGDIVTNRAAKALAAYEGRTEVTVEDVQKVIALCLRHRLPQKIPLESIDSGF